MAARELESTRDRLLDAAGTVFGERGYDGAGVQEIARRAGLTTGAIYANFRGKADLLLEAIRARSTDELDDLLAVAHLHGTAGELMAELGSHLLDRDPEEPGGLLIEAFVAARRDPDLRALVSRMLHDRSGGIGALVDEATAQGDVDGSVDTEALTSFCMVLALGSMLFKELGLTAPDQDGWSALIRRFVSSLKEPSTP